VEPQTLRERFVQLLLDRVREDTFPSVVQMNMIESTVRNPEQLVEYLEALMEKVEDTRFPSPEMLRRIQRIAVMLPA
jgi:hypothetical protein